ncbi:MAG: isocitrate lyase/phosphoenolpyruvate mutase family protein [Proteobacteria bacterium]|nr:isocitrate lyase/phosphoenolpyruvate mutase family protein [Pseudomonadota bacterium]
MSQAEKARVFTDLHRKGDPVILYNVWDAGSAKTAESAGSKALATGSWPVAAAQGYEDGEKIPLELVEAIVRRIVACVNVPLTVDFEGGYAENPADISVNAARIIAAGAIGVNFEDKIVGTKTLYDITRQVERIRAVRQAAEATGIPLFINARTDLFLVEGDRAKHPDLIDAAIARAAAYKGAGAGGFFAPGLFDEGAIGRLVSSIELPLNIIKLDPAPSIATLKKLGVARISYGPRPYREMHAIFAERCAAALAGQG